MATVLAFNPNQVRAPKGTDSGGQWMDTPGDVLEGLEAYQVFQRDKYVNTPEPFDPYREDHYHTAEFPNRPMVMLEQEADARLAYTTDKGHAKISEALRSGAISPPRGGATYGDAGYFDPRRQDGVSVSPFTREALVIGDGSGAVHALDGAMTDTYITAPVTLYRGLSVEAGADFSPGTRWYEPGYTSATFNPDAAIEFAKFRAGLPSDFEGEPNLREEDTSGEPLFMQIVVPPGTHFMPGAEMADELVLERGGTFEVLEDRGDSITVRFEPYDNTEPPALEEDA